MNKIIMLIVFQRYNLAIRVTIYLYISRNYHNEEEEKRKKKEIVDVGNRNLIKLPFL